MADVFVLDSSAWIAFDEAAKLKATHRLSFADSFATATAIRLGAMLVHKDPEFDALEGVMKLYPLPLKPGKSI